MTRQSANAPALSFHRRRISSRLLFFLSPLLYLTVSFSLTARQGPQTTAQAPFVMGMVQKHLTATSPDGRKVAFVTAAHPALIDSDLWLADTDGSNPLLIARHTAFSWPAQPIWSPDGTQLAYLVAAYDENGYGPTAQLWLYDVHSRQTRLLTADERFRPRVFFGQTDAVVWSDNHSLQFLDQMGTGKVYRVELASAQVTLVELGIHPTLQALIAEESVLRLATPSEPYSMVKPLPVRDYDGRVGHGYTTAYLGNYWGGPEGSGSHPGVDIAWSGICGETIRSIADGVVVWSQDMTYGDPNRCDAYSGPGYGSGSAAVVRHDNVPWVGPYGGTVFAVYMHFRDAPAVPGGSVNRGTVVGLVGSTGYSTGAHLHFQIDKDNSPFHPWWWSSGSGCNVNTTACQSLVQTYTWSPMHFVQAYLQPYTEPTPSATPYAHWLWLPLGLHHRARPTPTHTPSPTPTPSRRPTMTPTPSPTFTATLTPTATPSPTPTTTPRFPSWATPTPTATMPVYELYLTEQAFMPLLLR